MTDLYLYQTLHLQAGQPRSTAAHVAVLNSASQQLFGRAYTPDLTTLKKRIAAAARSERYPTAVSGFVRLELTAAGEERIIPAGISLYDGYALRSLTPDAVVVQYDNPFTDAPTSAREAAAQLAQRQAETAGAGVALQCDTAGVCRTADDAPLIAVRGRCLFVAPNDGTPCVERDLTLKAARAEGLETVEEPFTVGQLACFDELFYVDHRGVTALSRCEGRPYMSLVAEHLARGVEGLFRR